MIGLLIIGFLLLVFAIVYFVVLFIKKSERAKSNSFKEIILFFPNWSFHF